MSEARQRQDLWTRFKIVAARHRLRVATSAELVELANEALSEERYATPSVKALAVVEAVNMSEVAPLFEKALASLGLLIPDEDRAIWIYSRDILEDVAERRVPPREGIRRLVMQVHDAGQLHEKSRKFVGDSHDLHALIAQYYGYDDIEERSKEVSLHGKYGDEAIKENDELIVSLSMEWLKKHPWNFDYGS